jgi:hypothetical protein
MAAVNVFVSHRGADGDVAERIAAEIRDVGHDVWLDRWEIDVGDSVVGEIDQGLAAADYLVLCCSARGTDTPWISREWMVTLHRQLEGKGVKLLPAILDGGALPAILDDIKPANLARDWSAGMAELLRAIR